MRILLAAFNKRIAEELNARIAAGWRLTADPSQQQADIFDAILNRREHLVERGLDPAPGVVEPLRDRRGHVAVRQAFGASGSPA